MIPFVVYDGIFFFLNLDCLVWEFQERCENMMEYIKRLRLCIRWFQELEGDYAFELERLRNELEMNEQKCAELGTID